MAVMAASLVACAGELGRPLLRAFPPGRSRLAFLVQAVVQDRAGYVYLANSSLFPFYDGTVWQRIALPTEATGIRGFAIGPEGDVYAGGASVIGYSHRDGVTGTFISLADKLPPTRLGCDEIQSVAAVGDTVAFADEEKLLLWRGGRFTVVPYPSPAGSDGARLHVVGDVLYVTAPDRPLCRLEGDRLVTVVDDPLFRQERIVTMERGAEGTLEILSAGKGFFTVRDGQVRPRPVEANRWLAGRTVWRGCRLADGSHAVIFTAPSGDGGMIFDPAGHYLMPLDTSIGSYTSAVRSLYPDAEGGLWLGTEVGVFRIEWPLPLTIFDQVNGLGSGVVHDMVRHDGVLYVATSEGVFRLRTSDAAGHVARFERLLDEPTQALASHPSGVLALVAGRLVQLGPQGFAGVLEVPRDSTVLRSSTRDPDRLWLGTNHGVRSVHLIGRSWREEGALAGLSEAEIVSLTEESDGALWLTDVAGALFRVKWGSGGVPSDPRIERIGVDRDSSEATSRGRIVSHGGHPLLVTEGTPALWRINETNERLEAASAAARLPVATGGGAWTVAEGASTDSAIWLAGTAGIYRLGGDASLQRMSQLVGVAAGSVRRMLREQGPSGDVLWIGGTNGLVRLDLAGRWLAPVPLVTSIVESSVSEGERLPPDHAPVKFAYRAMRFVLGGAVEYQSRLMGGDGNWSSWEPEVERSFSRLPAGAYRFEVRARDADGHVSATATWRFVVKNHWWLTGWAIAGYNLVAVAVLGGLVRLRTRTLRQRAERLEKLVNERTRELAEKNVELTRLHRLEADEKVAARLAEEKARLEVLRYQLNPHFLFNTLASISASLPAGKNATRLMVDRLADFCRLTLHRADDREWTTLGDEMRLLRAYLEIEKSRWADLLTIEFDCESDLDGERLPYFLLLPLVENALKYGRATSPDQVGIRVLARRTSEQGFLIEVANTGEWIEPTAAKTASTLGIGLHNLRERLQRYYPRSHRLTFDHGANWVTVKLHLFRVEGRPGIAQNGAPRSGEI